MGTETTSLVVHPEGEQPEVGAWSAVADTYGGRVDVEWDATAPVTPFGQLPFFTEYLKQGGWFDGWVADCPLKKREGTAIGNCVEDRLILHLQQGCSKISRERSLSP